MGLLMRLYDRRIVNVNVNIVLAGLLAMGITVLVLHGAERVGLLEALGRYVGDFDVVVRGRRYEIAGEKLMIGGLTFVVDALADVLVYYGLHWVANHMPRRRPRVRGGYAGMTFLRDATLVQFERALLSPLLYLIALTTQNALLHRGWSVEAATAAGLGTGIATARLLHTLWMLRQERRAGRPSAADIVGPDIADEHGRLIRAPADPIPEPAPDRPPAAAHAPSVDPERLPARRSQPDAVSGGAVRSRRYR